MKMLAAKKLNLRTLAVLALSGFICTSTFAGDKIGNGGSIWACLDGKVLTQGYLLDLYEAREEFLLKIIAPKSQDPKQIAADLFNRLARTWPEFYTLIKPHMNEVLANI